jgi:hypothetical protein
MNVDIPSNALFGKLIWGRQGLEWLKWKRGWQVRLHYQGKALHYPRMKSLNDQI